MHFIVSLRECLPRECGEGQQQRALGLTVRAPHNCTNLPPPPYCLQAPHHKNTRRGFEPIEFVFPLGALTDLLLFHINHGHALIAEDVTLFNSRLGFTFTDQTFNW